MSLLFLTSPFYSPPLSLFFQISLLHPFEIWCVNLSRHTDIPLYFCFTFPLHVSLLLSLYHTPASSNSAVPPLFFFLSHCFHVPQCLVCAATVFCNCGRGSLYHSTHLLQKMHWAPLMHSTSREMRDEYMRVIEMWVDVSFYHTQYFIECVPFSGGVALPGNHCSNTLNDRNRGLLREQVGLTGVRQCMRTTSG